MSSRVDSYAIPEATKPEFAFGHGDLSIHEFATDPSQYLAYSSYYAGGVRVFRFGAGGIDEDRTVNILPTTGNTSAASIPMALAEAADDGRLAAGDLALLIGFGAGMSWASAVLEWGG